MSSSKVAIGMELGAAISCVGIFQNGNVENEPNAIYGYLNTFCIQS